MKKKIVKAMLLTGIITSLAIGGITGCGKAEKEQEDVTTEESRTNEETAENETVDYDLSKWDTDMWETATEDERKLAVWTCMEESYEKEGKSASEITEEEFELMYDVVETMFEENKDIMKDITLQDIVNDSVMSEEE